MKVADIMSRDVQMVGPTQNLVQAAQLMREFDIGVLPVAENEQLVGLVTDRDIVVRGLAEGREAAAISVSEVMSPEVLYCFDDQPLNEVAANMADQQVRRLPVVTHAKKLVGFLSLGDIAQAGADAEAATALAGVSEAKH